MLGLLREDIIGVFQLLTQTFDQGTPVCQLFSCATKNHREPDPDRIGIESRKTCRWTASGM